MSTPSKRVIKMELWFVTTLIIVPISILLIFFVMLGKGHVGIKIIKEITPHLEEIYLRYIEIIVRLGCQQARSHDPFK